MFTKSTANQAVKFKASLRAIYHECDKGRQGWHDSYPALLQALCSHILHFKPIYLLFKAILHPLSAHSKAKHGMQNEQASQHNKLMSDVPLDQVRHYDA
jgi:hypothetical protein